MIFVRDRVKQGTTTNGIGTISLTSSFGGYQDFSVLGNNSQTFYAIEESTNWEVGIGTYSGTTLTRDTVIDSASGVGTPIYLSGNANVFVTYPASGSVFSTGSIALATGIKLGSSGIVFSDGTAQTTAAASFSAASGAKIDSNTTGIYNTSGNLNTRISTIEGTGVATAANLASTGGTLYNNSVTTGNVLGSRISTIEGSGTLTGLGSAPSTNIKKLALWDATDGLTFDTNLTFNTSIDELVLGVSGIRFADASNQNTAFENWSLIVSNPDQEYYNYITAGSNTVGSGAGVDFSGVNGIYTTGQLISSKRHKVTISGVAGSTSQVGVLQLQDSVDTSTTKAVTPNAVRVVSGDLQSQIGSSSFTHATGAKIDSNTTGIYNTSGNLNTRISTIEGTGVATAANLASTGGTLYSNSVTTGNVLGSRISTIESTGVATAANLASTGGTLYSNSVTTGNVLHARISTIESTGVATAANLASTGGTLNSNLISTGNALFTGLYNTSGNLASLIPTESVACRLTTTQGTAVSEGVATKAVFDVIDYKYGNISGSIHPASASGRITLLETGIYYVNAGTAWQGFTQLGNWGIGIYKNGGNLASSSGDAVMTWAGDYVETSFGGDRPNNVNTVVTGVSGDYFEVYLWNENAGSTTRTNTASRTWFSVVKMQGSKGDKGDTGATGPAGGDYSWTASGTGLAYSNIYNADVVKITGAGDTTVTFTSGDPNIYSVSTTLSATTGAQIDSNSSRLSTIESTGVATESDLTAAENRISTIEATGVATAANLLSTGATNAAAIAAITPFSATSGARIDLNDSRISTIESTGVATAANLLSTGATNAADIASGLARISTIESTGVATAANLASTGGTLYSNSVTTGNVLHSRISTIESTGVATAANLLSTGATNAAAIAAITPFSATSGARIDLNDSRISTIESTGVATAANLASTGGTLYSNSVTTGNVLHSRISTIESTGVATAANLLSTGATNAADIASGLARISTIESTGVATAANLLSTGATNAAAIAAITPFSATSGARIDLNDSRISTIEATGVATAANLASTGGTLYSNSVTTGNVLHSRISTIEATGVATAANLLSTGATNAADIASGLARISTIESTGVATESDLTAAENRISTIEATGVATAANLLSTGATNAAAIAAITPFSATSGAKIDLNSSRLSTIESTGVATAANLASTGGTLYSNSVTTGNVLHSRISTIESTGVATAANLASTGGTLYSNSVTTGNVLHSRISTIESSGVATSANLIATGAVVQDGHQDINVSIATASGFVSPMISGNSTTVTNLDLSLGSNFNYKLAANTTFQVKNVTKGQKFTLRTEQDSTASRSVTFAFGSDVRWAEGGTAATGTEYPAGVADYYGFVAIETGLFMGFVIGNNIK